MLYYLPFNGIERYTNIYQCSFLGSDLLLKFLQIVERHEKEHVF